MSNRRDRISTDGARVAASRPLEGRRRLGELTVGHPRQGEAPPSNCESPASLAASALHSYPAVKEADVLMLLQACTSKTEQLNVLEQLPDRVDCVAVRPGHPS